MSSFKTYAKQAKQRLKNDFWKDVKREREIYINQTQTQSVPKEGMLVKQKQELKDKLYNSNYESDEKFYDRVKNLLTQKDVVINPIAVLADPNVLAYMTESQKQAYILKLSAKYQQAVEKFNAENNTNSHF